MELTDLNGDAATIARPSGDWFGMAASIGCAIHCIATPLVVGYLPAAGAAFLTDRSFHVGAMIVCWFIGVATFVPGWRRHGKLSPVVTGGLGLTAISLATLLAPECCAEGCCPHSVATASATPLPGLPVFAHIAGGLLLATGHLLNHRQRCQCPCHGAH